MDRMCGEGGPATGSSPPPAAAACAALGWAATRLLPPLEAACALLQLTVPHGSATRSQALRCASVREACPALQY